MSHQTLSFKAAIGKDKKLGIWLAQCKTTDNMVTADDKETAISMLLEMIEEELIFMAKHHRIRLELK